MGKNALHSAALSGPLAAVKAELARPNGKKLAMEQTEVSEDNVHTHSLSSFFFSLFSLFFSFLSQLI